ncbi:MULTISPECIES: hypothetical protein [unclassified Rhizobium]|uniref:hypothetical protein n=1 Tax=unclassified Rhizobium TaxID=2613769 RepID=UPI00161FE531|nr:MULTISPECIES: hypothetical protein [unclassified Rhizobium]MBB3319526.1 hypothetical protein [Rhizobium sp. BK181]MCS3743530.1 hypothetical protein [Rhizobium sp. BK661]MCS4095222.1 hypothetical protein [Rhizobium sp. BK176]
MPGIWYEDHQEVRVDVVAMSFRPSLKNVVGKRQAVSRDTTIPGDAEGGRGRVGLDGHRFVGIPFEAEQEGVWHHDSFSGLWGFEIEDLIVYLKANP